VPTSEDFERLESSILHSETLVDEWGYTGFVNARANNDQSVEMDDMNRGWVISKTRETGNNGYNKALRYPSTGWGLVSYGAHASGYVVRCVK
jgi:hypothetical protein